MRVYHFLNKQYGLQAIKERRLKKSIIMKLNDPFEFYGIELTDREFRRNMKYAKEHVSKQFGIHCFSRDWRNPVQWAHYANRHTGLCLGFDVPTDLLEKVNYVVERVDHNGELNEDLVFKLLKTKFVHWQYEDEYRQFVPLEEPENGVHYSNFSNELLLKQVIVGEYSTMSRSQLSESLGKLDNSVEKFKARAGFHNFEMVENQNERLWA